MAEASMKETETQHKTDRRRDVDAETKSLQEELSLTQEELDAANAHYEKLNPDCEDNGLSYDDSVRMQGGLAQAMNQASKEDQFLCESPVVEVAVKVKDGKGLPKLVDGLKKLSESDPLVICATQRLELRRPFSNAGRSRSGYEPSLEGALCWHAVRERWDRWLVGGVLV